MIKRLYICNVGPFRGEHTIDLTAGAYAMVARHELDPRRSNALGKSMLAATIRFCVTGQWPRRYGDADGWISRGERSACAMLMLEDGAAVERKKVRGKSREARAKTPGTGWKEAFNDDATGAMLRHLGLASEAEFSETCYVGQKRADAFMLVDPSARLSIVSGWLGLGSAERAIDRAGEELDALTREVDRVVAERDRLRLVAAEDAVEDPAKLRQSAKMEREFAATIGEHLNAVMVGLAAEARLVGHDERVRRGKALRAEADANPPPLVAVIEAARKALAFAEVAESAARKLVEEREQVAAGRFSGKCPVAGRDCPVTAEINADALTAKARLTEAQAGRRAAREHAAAMLADLKPLEAAVAAHEHRQRDLKRLRDEVRENGSAKEDRAAADAARKLMESMQAPTLAEACSRLQDQLRDANRTVGQLDGEAAAAERARERRASATAELDVAEAAVEVAIARRKLTADARSCARAAQRRVAERALSAIEIGANDALAEAGVEMRLRARWEREGKDPARHCEDCGASFPASRKVKECERCGAARGLNVVQRLDLVADGASDGLDDLAGVAWQHAAAGWLLRARQSPWSTCILDEPTAHLDHPSRQGLVRYLGSAMRRGIVRQTILISHSQETTESLGKKIVITCAANGERRIEVV